MCPMRSIAAQKSSTGAKRKTRSPKVPRSITSAVNSILIPRTTLAAFGAPCLDFEVWGEDTEQAQRRHALAGDIATAARFLWLLRQ